MTALCGSRVAGRNCVLVRFASLVNWGKCNKPYKFSSGALNRSQHQVAKCQRWTISNTPGYYFVTGNVSLYGNCINKNEGWLLNAKNSGKYSVGYSFSSQLRAFCEQRVREKEALFGTFLSQKTQNFAAAQNLQNVRPFHGSSPLKAAPVPILLMILKPAQKLLAIILGRSIRKWWHALPPNKKDIFKEAVQRNKWKIILGLCSLGVLFMVFYFTHLEETPITGRARLLVFGKEHFTELSQFEYNMWVEEFKNKMIPERDPRYQIVKKTFLHIAESNKDVPQISDLKWTIHVVEEPGINAFVLPNGQVFVFTGLLTAVSDINQLSFILAHEIAHAVLGHAAEKASLLHFVDFLSLILLTMIWAACPRDSLAILGQWIQARFQELLFDKPYSRTLEAEADKVGLQFAAKACMDVRASSVFWQQMELAETITGHPKVPEWLSTHPSHDNRAERLDRLIPEAIKIREHCNCPALPSQDPRLLFKLARHHYQQASKVEEGTNVTHHDLEKTKVNPLFIRREKVPVTIVNGKELSR